MNPGSAPTINCFRTCIDMAKIITQSMINITFNHFGSFFDDSISCLAKLGLFKEIAFSPQLLQKFTPSFRLFPQFLQNI